MILFLDFDGVLHPQPTILRPGRGVFTALHLLEDVLRQVPHVEVVISSSWRMRHPFGELREFFAPDVRDRIVGVTPMPGDVAEAPRELHNECPRHAECLAWLARHRPPGTPWLALDDIADEFAPQCRNLMLIDGARGLMPDTAQALLLLLTRGRKHTLADMIAQCDPSATPPADLAQWDRSPPVGGEEMFEADKPPRESE